MLIQKIGLIVLVALSSLYALDITVKPSNTYKISSEEAEYFRNMLMKRHVNIDPDEAKKLLKENRVFADYFYKTYGIEPNLKELRIVFEEKLTKDLLKKEIEKVSINEDVLLSFFKDNKEKYYKNKEIEFKVYNFEGFEEAYEFYQKCKSNIALCDKSATENNVTVVHQTVPLHNFNPQLHNLLQDDNHSNYIVPPQKFFKNYIVLEVVHISDKGILPYEKVKEKVKKDLQKKIRQNVKRKLSKQLLSTSE